MPFLPSLDRRFLKNRRMQKPQMPRIMRRMRTKIATTPHVGMPDLSAKIPTPFSPILVIFDIVEAVDVFGASVPSSEMKSYKYHYLVSQLIIIISPLYKRGLLQNYRSLKMSIST